MKDSQRADNLQRQMLDLQNHNGVVRTELSMPNPRPNWMRPVANTLTKLPFVLRKTGQSLKAGVDIASPFVHRWNNFWSNLTDFVLEEVKITGDTIIEGAVPDNYCRYCLTHWFNCFNWSFGSLLLKRHSHSFKNSPKCSLGTPLNLRI